MSQDANQALVRRFYEEVWGRDVDFVLADGDFVAGRWTATGTHIGSWAGVEPTGRSMEFSGINVFRFSNGKVVELWNHRDALGLMQQLGAPVYAGASE
jgi:predicted ester cyclase